VCFEGHTLTMVTGDVIPVDPLDYNCIDINSGQRCGDVYTFPMASHPH